MSVVFAGFLAFVLRDVGMSTLFLVLLAAFVLSHIGMATPAIRDRLVARLGERGFQGVYSLISVLLLGGAIHAYGALDPYPVWTAPGWAWPLSSALMLVASVLLVGSLTPANKAMAGVPVTDRPPSGVMRITRHPMMWSFAIWALVHCWLSGSLPTVILAFAIGLLALLGAAHQDMKKRRLLGETWARYESGTSYWPFGAQLSGKQPWSALWPGAVPVAGGVLLWALLTFVHPKLLGAPVVPPWGILGGL